MSLTRFCELRQAGRVQRCHNRPHHGSYSIAEHVAQCLHILFSFHPNPSIGLIKAITYHDHAEYWTGDIPANAKWAWPALAMASQNAEHEVNERLDIPHVDGLSEHDHLWLVRVDSAELALWCIDQIDLGNTHAKEILNRIVDRMREREMPDELVPLWWHVIFSRVGGVVPKWASKML